MQTSKGQSYQPSIYSFVFQQKDYAIGRYSAADRTAKNNPLGFNDPPYPVKNAPLYTVNIGDTLASIATQFFGDVAAVPLIARENGLLLSHHHLKPGTVLRLPQYFSIYNKATTSEPYQKFSSIMLGSLAPHMATPEPHKDHDSFFDFAKIIALEIIASIVATPATATFLLGLLGFTSTTTAALITTDVLAGLGDAAVQGVAIGLKAQSKFSLSEMFEFAISAGMGSGATLSPSTMTVLRSLFQETTTNITLQLAEMKLGLRDKFDAQSLVQQALSAVVGASISPEVKAEIGNDAFLRTTVTIADTAAESILGSEITNTPPNIEADVANVIGSVASSSIQKGMDDGEADDTQQADPMSQTSSSHDEIEQAEGVANFQVDDPTLPLDSGPRYGAADYGLSEMNRRQMAGTLFSSPAPKGGYFRGFYDKVKGGVSEVVQVATHPLELLQDSIRNDLDVLANPDLWVREVKEVAYGVRDGILKDYNDIRNGDLYALGRDTPGLAMNLVPALKLLAGGKFLFFAKTEMGVIGEDLLSNTFSKSESTLNHIFRDSSGHISDTPENRKLIKSVANNKNAYLGEDKYGNEWFAQQHPAGGQIWVRVRNGEITNAGWNQEPREFNPQTGLNRPDKINKPKF